MFGNKLTAAVVSLTTDPSPPALDGGDDRIELTSYPSLTPWLGNGPDPVGSSRGLAASAPTVPTSDCVVVIGIPSEIARNELATRFADCHPGLPLIVFAADPTIDEAVRLMQQGAHAVISQATSGDTTTATLVAAAAKGRAATPTRRRLLELRSRFAELTKPEREVLDAMLSGLANKMIAQRLEIGLRTVELRRSKIMRKMGASSLAELVKLVCHVKPSLMVESPSEVAYRA